MASQPPLDDLLVRLAASREDKEAWNLLYERLWPRVKATTYRALGGLHDLAEDAAQEVFLRLVLYCDFAKFHNAEEFRKYLHVVARNAVGDFLSELQWQLLDIAELEIELQKVLPSKTPEQRAATRQILKKVWSELDGQEKELALLVSQGYSMSEVAERLGWTASNVGVRLHRLRARALNFMHRKGLV